VWAIRDGRDVAAAIDDHVQMSAGMAQAAE
jgi:hypothetical protein